MDHVAQIRAFNRFYTRQIGLLDGLLPERLGLTEARVIYEIGARPKARAKGVADDLGLDEGYVSRVLKKLVVEGFVERRPSGDDARAKVLNLTPKGRSMQNGLVSKAESFVGDMLRDVDPATRDLLIEAMSTIHGILGQTSPDMVDLRPFQTGDIGWLVKRYGEICAVEGNFDLTFEALVARIAGGIFEDGHAPGSTGWVAVREGARLGGILYTEEDATTGRLRTLIVEPSARGLGIGQRLVDQVIGHAEAQEKERLILWTEKGLEAAVRLYERTGFRLVDEVKEHDFGRVMINQTWQLDLTGGDKPRLS